MYPTAITAASYAFKTSTIHGHTQYRCRGAKGTTISDLCADFLKRHPEWSSCNVCAGKLVLSMNAAATAAAVSRLDKMLAGGWEIATY